MKAKFGSVWRDPADNEVVMFIARKGEYTATDDWSDSVVVLQPIPDHPYDAGLGGLTKRNLRVYNPVRDAAE